MKKAEFFLELSRRLTRIPWTELEDRWNFYSEMIDDRMEEGMTEEEAVAAIGTVDEVAAQILEDVPLVTLAREQLKPRRRLGAWEIVLLILGSPLWLSLVLAGFAIVVSVYAVLWSVIVSLWAVVISVWACVLGFLLGGILLALSGRGIAGGFLIGCSLICAGLSVFLFHGVKAASKGAGWLTRLPAKWLRRSFFGKECSQ